jgi:hypothetical protein
MMALSMRSLGWRSLGWRSPTMANRRPAIPSIQRAISATASCTRTMASS